ncbi:uncharacterized mitochondrial protein-like protein [Tanacetum coccineum]
MNQFCDIKGIKREFSVARTPQQNKVAERKNRTLIEAVRTMLVDSKLPTTFWAEAVNTACYVLNRVLIIKPHNKTPYELIRGRPPLLDFMKPFGCRVTILNTRDHLGKFNGKADEGFLDNSGASNKDERMIKPMNTHVSAAGPSFTNDDPSSPVNAAEASNAFEEHLFERFSPFKNCHLHFSTYVGAEADFNNLETTMNLSPIPTTRIDKDHPKDQIIVDFNSAIQTRRMTKISDEHAMMDVKSAFLYGTIDEEVYVDDIIFGSTKKSLCDEFEGLMHKRFQISSIGELTFFLGLQVQQKKDGIFISQDKYVADILKKFDFATVKTASTPMEPNKALIKDEKVDSVDVHLYRSMIGSLMYLIASRPDKMFAIYACARFQVTPKMLHLHVVKRIFRYLKGQLKLGLWLISWQCKKQTIVANSTTEAEYVAAANCCGQCFTLKPSTWRLGTISSEIVMRRS